MFTALERPSYRHLEFIVHPWPGKNQLSHPRGSPGFKPQSAACSAYRATPLWYEMKKMSFISIEIHWTNSILATNRIIPNSVVFKNVLTNCVTSSKNWLKCTSNRNDSQMDLLI